MPRIEREIDIEAPPEQVFAYATAEENQTKWIVFLKEYRITSEQKQGAGITDRCVIQMGPRKEEMDAVCTEYVPGQVYARRTTSGLQMEGRLTFEPAGDSTLVAWTVDYTPPMGALGVVVDLLLMRRLFINQVEDSLERLKQQLEQAAG